MRSKVRCLQSNRPKAATSCFTLQVLTQKNKSRPTSSRLHLPALTGPGLFYRLWHNHSSSKHDSPLYTKLYDSSDPMLFPFTWVNIQRPRWTSAYCSRLERQTASLLSPSLQSVERETSQKRRRGKGQRGFSCVRPMPSSVCGGDGDRTDDRVEGRAGVPWPAHPSSVVTWGPAAAGATGRTAWAPVMRNWLRPLLSVHSAAGFAWEWASPNRWMADQISAPFYSPSDSSDSSRAGVWSGAVLVGVKIRVEGRQQFRLSVAGFV